MKLMTALCTSSSQKVVPVNDIIYTCKYQGDYHVIDDGITSLYTCTEEADLLIPTFLSDKDFSPNQTEHDLFYKTSARDEYIHLFRYFFNNQAVYHHCVIKIILEEV